VIKVWGRKTSANVQKVMWAIGEIGLPHERIDIGGPFGKNREPGLSGDEPERAGADLGRRGWLPAVGIERDRSPSRRQAPLGGAGACGPKSAGTRQPMDGLATLRRRAGHHAGLPRLDPHAARKTRPRRDRGVEEADDRGDGHPRCAAGENALRCGDGFSYGDIPVAIMVYRYRQLVPQRPPLPEMERWYAEVSTRQAFKDHVGAVPLT
jgi:glutathione S-transferase